MTVCSPERLSQYLDDGLTLPERKRLEEHIRLCGVCAAELAQLRRVDERLTAFGSSQRPVPPEAGARISSAVERRRRLGPIVAISKMVPAALGSSVAAVLVLVSVNLGILYQSQTNNQTNSSQFRSKIVRQSRPLTSARRMSAIMGSPIASQALLPAQHRTQLDIN